MTHSTISQAPRLLSASSEGERTCFADMDTATVMNLMFTWMAKVLRLQPRLEPALGSCNATTQLVIEDILLACRKRQ